MNGTIEIKIPYPVSFLGFHRFIKRDIGFSFDQRAIYQLHQNNNLDLPEHSDWLKKTPQAKVVLETLYAGAQSYCIERRQKDNFTKEGLSKALNECDEATVESITNCWKQSEQFGFKKIPSKKKAVNQ